MIFDYSPFSKDIGVCLVVACLDWIVCFVAGSQGVRSQGAGEQGSRRGHGAGGRGGTGAGAGEQRGRGAGGRKEQKRRNSSRTAVKSIKKQPTRAEKQQNSN